MSRSLSPPNLQQSSFQSSKKLWIFNPFNQFRGHLGNLDCSELQQIRIVELRVNLCQIRKFKSHHLSPILRLHLSFQQLYTIDLPL